MWSITSSNGNRETWKILSPIWRKNWRILYCAWSLDIWIVHDKLRYLTEIFKQACIIWIVGHCACLLLQIENTLFFHNHCSWSIYMVVRQIRYIVTINVVIKIITYMSCIYLPTEKLVLSGTVVPSPTL